MNTVDVDVLIVGAGLSGIDMAVRLLQHEPERSFAILEGRQAVGGTWDLFRYPGVRSDSDMYTLSYPFRPWTDPEAIAPGHAIVTYLRDTVREWQLDERIHRGQSVTAASWSSQQSRWTVTTSSSEGEREHRARFLYLATGYYDYDQPHTIDLPGQETFSGTLVHPQFWPQTLDVDGARVVVIGSGATAVTLVPALVDSGAAEVTMLQRSPTWVLSLPTADPLARLAFRALPATGAHRLLRAKNIAAAMASYGLARRFPTVARSVLTAATRKALPAGYDVRTHFTPRYDPWDQRLCVVPDGDLFAALSSGRARIVTDTIAAVESDAVVTTGGERLAADIIVTATGLRMVVAGNIALTVDGEAVAVHERHLYRGAMLSGVPNLVWCVGYTNNSWTLRADLLARWTCGLLAHLAATGRTQVTPRYRQGGPDGGPISNLTSGYIRRAAGIVPRQGRHAPWVFRQNYLRDLAGMRPGSYTDGHLEFSGRPQ